MSDSPSFEDVLAGMEEAMGDGAGDGEPWGSPDGTGDTGSAAGESGNPSGGSGTGSGRGPLTTAEQVAVLDAQLEQGTGEFDAMILEEQQQQREAARQSEAQPVSTGGSSAAGTTGNEYGRGSVASSGYGGGIGGGTGASQIPQDTAKYPPPADIPSGDDDDVVARQLREAAMREPDPAVREKLWDEYRKYKGIDS